MTVFYMVTPINKIQLFLGLFLFFVFLGSTSKKNPKNNSILLVDIIA